jgi:hypothetical protein
MARGYTTANTLISHQSAARMTAYLSPGERERRIREQHDAERATSAEYERQRIESKRQRDARSYSRVLQLLEELKRKGCPGSLFVEKTVRLTPRQAAKSPKDRLIYGPVLRGQILSKEARKFAVGYPPRFAYGVTAVVRGWHDSYTEEKEIRDRYGESPHIEKRTFQYVVTENAEIASYAGHPDFNTVSIDAGEFRPLTPEYDHSRTVRLLERALAE